MKKILLIDDEESIRSTLMDCLDSAGYAVEEAENGRMALRLIESTAYDLIIADVFMPEVDGIELIQILNEKDDHPPIVAISGGGGILPPNWSIKIAEIYGVDAALMKPIDMKVFLGSVEQALHA